MSQVSALLKKEVMESVRNFKLFGLITVFIIIGIMSPLLALLLPDILESVMRDMGITLDIPVVTAVDSYTQFFSNMNQIGLVIFVIVIGGILTYEFSKNTMVILITKGLKRHNIIIVKSLYALILWTVSYVLSAVVTYIYTIYYWNDEVQHLVVAFGLTWVYGIFLISVIMLASTIFKSSFLGVLISVIAVVVLMVVLSIHPAIGEYMPQYLIGVNIEVLTGAVEVREVIPSLLTTVGASILLLGLSIMTFNKSAI